MADASERRWATPAPGESEQKSEQFTPAVFVISCRETSSEIVAAWMRRSNFEHRKLIELYILERDPFEPLDHGYGTSDKLDLLR